MEVKCYQLGDLCYYVTEMQDQTIQKFKGDARESLIRRTAFATGPLGEPIKGPGGASAIILPEGVDLPEEEEEQEASGEEEGSEAEVSEEGSEAEVSGVHL